jgi:hypothetical protein
VNPQPRIPTKAAFSSDPLGLVWRSGHLP